MPPARRRDRAGARALDHARPEPIPGRRARHRARSGAWRSANAQAMFKRYRKAKAALANVPRLIEETERLLAYIDSQVDARRRWPSPPRTCEASRARPRRPSGGRALPEKGRGRGEAGRQLGAPLRVVADGRDRDPRRPLGEAERAGHVRDRVARRRLAARARCCRRARDRSVLAGASPRPRR